MADTIDFSKYQTVDNSSANSQPSSSGIDFSKYSSPSATTGSNAGGSSGGSSGIDFSKYTGVSSPTPTSSQPPASSGWNGLLDNPISRAIGTGYTHTVGGLQGLVQSMFDPTGHQGFLEGLMNPTAANQGYQQLKSNVANAINPIIQNDMSLIPGVHPSPAVGNAITNFGMDSAADPLSYVPVGPIAKVLGTGAKLASDAVGATPYIKAGFDAAVNAPIIKPAIQGVQDALGHMFTPNYGASPALVNILGNTKGLQAVDQHSILSSLSDLSQGHGLNPDELNQIGHVTEGTMQGTPEQQTLAQNRTALLDNGPQLPQGMSPIGTHAMLNAPSAVNGEPLLRSQIDNHFMHMYDSVPADQVGTFPKADYGGSGLSPDGSFNQPRTYATLQDAQANGLKPVLDPFQVAGQQLKQSSDAIRNNEALTQIKNTPGLLFPKDPIDEIAKLAKTGRMDSAQITQAKQTLGLSAADMQKGAIVQSKIPQLSGYYIRKADEAALQEHLNPSQPEGFGRVANTLENTYNKGYLLNPLPHMHNITGNGMILGEANPSYVTEAYNNFKNGADDPNYLRALKAGAISNPVGGKFSDAVNRAVEPTGGNIVSKTYNNLKSSAANLQTGVGKLTDNLKAPFEPLANASHNLLWNTDKAIRTALFRGAVEKGATDAEAAAHVNKFMVNYNNITPFERQYIKPYVPFYAWKKGNLPLQASQMLAQTPKYTLWGHAKDAVSQALSGQPADQKGRINSGQQLSDGSHTMLDFYNPMDDVTKIIQKGIPAYAYGSLSPVIKETIAQLSSLSGATGQDVQNKFPIYNPAAPLGFNLRAGAAHAINALNPFSGSAVAGGFGNQSNLINNTFGMPTNNKPDLTPTEILTKLLGGFTARDNPVTNAKNQYYQQRDNKINFSKYMKVLSKIK